VSSLPDVDELNKPDEVRSLRAMLKVALRQCGERVIPIVELANKPMKTRHGGSKLRPHFKIAGWCGIGGGGKATPLLEHVDPPTVAEEVGDEIPF
jgi:hypothetical protein